MKAALGNHISLWDILVLSCKYFCVILKHHLILSLGIFLGQFSVVSKIVFCTSQCYESAQHKQKGISVGIRIRLWTCNQRNGRQHRGEGKKASKMLDNNIDNVICLLFTIFLKS
jgi:hypothetical protein